jgi:copper chaperone CopZ
MKNHFIYSTDNFCQQKFSSTIKKIILSILLLTGFLANAQFVKANLQASGLTCSMCSFATQKQLKTLDFIDSVGTDLNHTIFILYFKKDAKVDIDLIRKKVEDAGFSVASLKITFHFDNLAITDNYHFAYQGNLYHFVNSKPQTLNGDAVFKVLDKGFVSDKEYKKYLKTATQPDDQQEKTADVNRVYHISLL